MLKNVFFFLTLFLGLSLFQFIPQQVFAYNQFSTHPALTSEMAKLFNNKSGSTGVHISAQQIQWLRQGAIDEDAPPRWINHFYDPIYKIGWLAVLAWLGYLLLIQIFCLNIFNKFKYTLFYDTTYKKSY